MDNDYGVSPFALMRAIGPLMMIAPLLIWMIISGPLVLYPIARWRAHREAAPDHQLGLKVALGYFGMLAFQLALLGGTTVVFAVLSSMGSDDKGSAFRFGFGLLVPAGLVLGGARAMVRRTNQDQFPGVRRLFLGYNFLTTGLFAFGALVFAFEALFGRGSSGDGGRLAWAGLLVYGGAWAAIGSQFVRIVLGGYTPPPSDELVAPPPPPPATPTLPSLGGGAYPPIK